LAAFLLGGIPLVLGARSLARADLPAS